MSRHHLFYRRPNGFSMPLRNCEIHYTRPIFNQGIFVCAYLYAVQVLFPLPVISHVKSITASRKIIPEAVIILEITSDM